MTTTIIYAGRRFDGKSFSYYYLEATSFLTFGKRLSYERIGDAVECERTETGVKGPYKVITSVEKERVTEWSILDTLAVESKTALTLSKVKPDRHIASLINAVKENTNSYQTRKKIALYIYTKILE